MTGLTRRAVLATGVGLVGTAGCTARLPLGDDERAFDAAPIAEQLAETLPSAPAVFPVDVPDDWMADHRERARELLASVPDEPDIPNGAVAAELSTNKTEVADDIDRGPEADTPIDRLKGWRRRRARAARVAGTYRAATGDASRAAAVRRSERLRRALMSFQRSWRYEAAAPPAAVVFHARLEDIVGWWARAVEEWPPYPPDPQAAVFRVGDTAGALERAAALRTDAARLRERYRTTRETAPYRYDLVGAVERLRYTTERRRTNLDEFIRRPEAAPPLDRDIEGTPAGVAYHSVREIVGEGTQFEGRRNDVPARRVLEVGRALAGKQALAVVIRNIQNGAYEVPNGAAAVGTRYEAALSALRTAWDTTPRTLAVAFMWPAYDLFRRAHEELASEGDETIREECVVDATGWLVAVERHAAAVPSAVERAMAALPAR